MGIHAQGQLYCGQDRRTPHAGAAAPVPGLGHPVRQALSGAGKGPAAGGLRQQTGVGGGDPPQALRACRRGWGHPTGGVGIWRRCGPGRAGG